MNERLAEIDRVVAVHAIACRSTAAEQATALAAGEHRAAAVAALLWREVQDLVGGDHTLLLDTLICGPFVADEHAMPGARPHRTPHSRWIAIKFY
jgi:hypothetical protein